MTLTLGVILLVVALILFILAGLSVNTSPVQLGWIGLGFFVAYFLVGK